MKYCVDCKYHVDYACHQERTMLGHIIAEACENERGDNGICGREAKFWEPTLWYRIKRFFGGGK